MARLDNINGSPWLNLKLGKFELDNLLSEKRILTLTGNGVFISSITSFHCTTATFSADGRQPTRGGGNGHSYNDRTRYSVALLSSNDGTTQLPYGSESYSTFITAVRRSMLGDSACNV